MTTMKWLMTMAALPMALSPLAATAQTVGEDAALCNGGHGPAIQANIVGMKDRAGEVKLEIYPANETDFLRDDYLLIREHKLFRRITALTPKSGAVSLNNKEPNPERYAILFTHNRDSQSKFNFWSDGAGFPSRERMGRSRPKLHQAQIDA